MSNSLSPLNVAPHAYFNGKRAARTKAMFAAVVASLAGLSLMLPEHASASFYGTSTERYSDVVNVEALVGSNGGKQDWLPNGSQKQLATAGCRSRQCRYVLNK